MCLNVDARIEKQLKKYKVTSYLMMSVDVSQRRCSYRNTTGKMQGDIVFNDVGQLKCYSRMSVDVS